MDNLLLTLTKKKSFRIRASGRSMIPTLFPNDIILISKTNYNKIQVDDIVLVKRNVSWYIHRIIYIKNRNFILTKGDNSYKADLPLIYKNIIGKVVGYKRNNTKYLLDDLYKRQSSIYLQEINSIFNLFNINNIQYVLLKGWPLHLKTKSIYPIRIYADCEILIKHSYSTFVNDSFGKCKYLNQHIDNTRTIFYKSFKGFVITFYINYKINILLNQFGSLTKLFPHNGNYELEDIFLKKKTYVKYNSQFYPVLSDANLIIYLCLHFLHFNFKELYRLRLIADVIQTYSNENSLKKFNALSRIITKYNLQNLLYPTFILLIKYFDSKIPKEFLKTICPPKKIVKYINKYIIIQDVAQSEFGSLATWSRFRNLFFLSSVSIYRRILLFLQLQSSLLLLKIRNRSKI